jgi:heme-degrading monooxygenase HmoA
MWESRLRDGNLDGFCDWIATQAWPVFSTTEGFLGGEVYRSDAECRAVVVTRWADQATLRSGNEWFDLGAERFTDNAPHAWEFAQVPTEV